MHLINKSESEASSTRGLGDIWAPRQTADAGGPFLDEKAGQTPSPLGLSAVVCIYLSVGVGRGYETGRLPLGGPNHCDFQIRQLGRGLPTPPNRPFLGCY